MIAITTLPLTYRRCPKCRSNAKEETYESSKHGWTGEKWITCASCGTVYKTHDTFKD